MTTMMKCIFFSSLQHYHPQSQHPNYQGLHEDHNHQPAHRWRRHVLPALSHFLGGDFSTLLTLGGWLNTFLRLPWKFELF